MRILSALRRRRGGRIGAQLAAAHAELAAAHAELTRRQRFTDALLETIEVGIVSCDAQGTFVVSNRAERELFGLDHRLGGLPMGHLGTRIDVFDGDGRRLDPDDYPLMRALRGEDVAKLEVRAGPAGGPHHQLVVRGRQIVNDDGRVLGAVAALADVTAERTAARQLADEHRLLAEAQRLGQLGSFDHDFTTGTWSFSDHLAALWGLAPGEVDTDRLATLVTPADRSAARRAWQAACARGDAGSFDLRIQRADDGAERLIRCNVEILLDADGRPCHGRGTHLDITELHAAQQAAQQANAFFDAILTATPDFTFVVDVATGTVIYLSPGKDVLGLDTDELTASGFAGIVDRAHLDDRAKLVDHAAAAAGLADGQVLQLQYRGHRADGRWRWLSHRITPFRRDASGAVAEVLAVVRDVTDLVDAEQRLVHAARHDHLTGLPNRTLLVERLEAALTRSAADGRPVAVLFCDLDGFKTVNDSGGHATGDAVLVEVARRLVAAVRTDDVVARVGGDEFVVVVEPWHRRPGTAADPVGAPEPILAVQLAGRIIDALRRPVTVDGVDHLVTASIGIAYATGAASRDGGPVSADQVLRHADQAMYRAKDDGKNQVAVLEEPVLAGLPGRPGAGRCS